MLLLSVAQCVCCCCCYCGGGVLCYVLCVMLVWVCGCCGCSIMFDIVNPVVVVVVVMDETSQGVNRFQRDEELEIAMDHH